ncbi:MAG TPA: ATP-binding protein [Cytophagaceae bacterium]|jgi:serine/threonine-protein kinase RsbW|nr:ATP-binding protein [Cytophagaceae bacterium]
MVERIKIACTTENLKEVRKFVNSTLLKFHISENEINMIVLAVDEICANRIIHSNQSNRNNQLEVEISDKEEGLLFNIKDTGDFYDNTIQGDPEILNLVKEKRKGGIGLMLVRKIMDSIEVKNESPYTTYTLFKKMNITHA